MPAPLRKDPRRAAAQQQPQQRDSLLSTQPRGSSSDALATTPLDGTPHLLSSGGANLRNHTPGANGTVLHDSRSNGGTLPTQRNGSMNGNPLSVTAGAGHDGGMSQSRSMEGPAPSMQVDARQPSTLVSSGPEAMANAAAPRHGTLRKRTSMPFAAPGAAARDMGRLDATHHSAEPRVKSGHNSSGPSTSGDNGRTTPVGPALSFVRGAGKTQASSARNSTANGSIAESFPAGATPVGSPAGPSPTMTSPITSMLPSLQSKLKLSEGLNCVDFMPMFRALAIGSTRQLHVVEVVPAIAYDMKDSLSEKASQADATDGNTYGGASSLLDVPSQTPRHHADPTGPTGTPPDLSARNNRNTSSSSAPSAAISNSPFVLRSAGSFGGLVKVESVAWYPSEEEASLAFIQPGRSITIFLDALQFKADGTFITQQWTRSQRKEKTLQASMAVGAGCTDTAIVAAGTMFSSTPLTSMSMGSTYTQASSTGGGGGGGGGNALSTASTAAVGMRSPAFSCGGGREMFVTRDQKGPLAKELIELNIDITYMRVEKILWDPHNPYTLALSSTVTYFEIWQIQTDGDRVYAPHLVLRPPAHNTRATVRDIAFSPSDPNLIVVMSELASAGQVLLYDRRQVEIPRVVDCITMGPGLTCAFHPLFSDLLAVAFRKEKTKSDCRIAFLRVMEEETVVAPTHTADDPRSTAAAAGSPGATAVTTTTGTAAGAAGQTRSGTTPGAATPSGLDTPTTNTSVTSSALSPARPPPLPFPVSANPMGSGAHQSLAPGASTSAFDDANSSVQNLGYDAATTTNHDAASTSVGMEYPGVVMQDTLAPVDCFASVSKLRWRPPSLGVLTKAHPHHHYLGFRPSLAELLRDEGSHGGCGADQGSDDAALTTAEETGAFPSDSEREKRTRAATTNGTTRLAAVDASPHSPLSLDTPAVTAEEQRRQRRLDLLASQLWFATTATTTDLDVSVWDAACSFFPICCVSYQNKESREPNDFIWVNELTIVSVFKSGEVVVTSLLNANNGTLLTTTPGAEQAATSTSVPAETSRNGAARLPRRNQQASSSAAVTSLARRPRLSLPVYPRDDSSHIFSLHSILPTAAVTSDYFGRSFAVRNTAVPLRSYYTHVMQRECQRLVARLVAQVRQEEAARPLVAAWRGMLATPSPHMIQSRIQHSQQLQQQKGLAAAAAAGGKSPQPQQQAGRGIGSRTSSGIHVRPHRAAQRAGQTDSPLLPSTTRTSEADAHDRSSRESTTQSTPLFPDLPPRAADAQRQREEAPSSLLSGRSTPANLTQQQQQQQPTGPTSPPITNLASARVAPSQNSQVMPQDSARSSVSPSLHRPVDAGELKIPLIARLLGFRKRRHPTDSHSTQPHAGSVLGNGGTALDNADTAVSALPQQTGTTAAPAAREDRDTSLGDQPPTPVSPFCHNATDPRQTLTQPVVVHPGASARVESRRQSPLAASTTTAHNTAPATPAAFPSSYDEDYSRGGTLLQHSSRQSSTLTGGTGQPHPVTRYGPAPEEGFRSGLPHAPVSLEGPAPGASFLAKATLTNGAGGGASRSRDGLSRRAHTLDSELADAFLDVVVPGSGNATSAASIAHLRMFPLLEQSAVRPVKRSGAVWGSGSTLAGSPGTPHVLVGPGSGSSAHAELHGTEAAAATSGGGGILSRKPTVALPVSPSTGQAVNGTPVGVGGGMLTQGQTSSASLKMRPTILTSPVPLPASPLNRVTSPMSLGGAGSSSVTFSSPLRDGASRPSSPTAAGDAGAPSTGAMGSAAPFPGIRKVTTSYKDPSDDARREPGAEGKMPDGSEARVPMQTLQGHLVPLQRTVQPVMECFAVSDAVCAWAYTERSMEEGLFARYALQWDMGYELALNMKKLRHLCDDAAETRRARQQNHTGLDGGGDDLSNHRHHHHHPDAGGGPARRRRNHEESLFTGSNQLIRDMTMADEAAARGPQRPLDDEDDILAAALHFSPKQADSLFAAMMEHNARICEVLERATRHERELRRREQNDPTSAMAKATATTAVVSGSPNTPGEGNGGAAQAAAESSRDPRSQWWYAAAHAWRTHQLDIICTLTAAQLEYASLVGDVQYCLVLYILFGLWWRLRYLPDHLHMKAARMEEGEAAQSEREDIAQRMTDPLAWRPNPAEGSGGAGGGEVPSAHQTGGRRQGTRALRPPPPCPLLPERQSHWQRPQKAQRPQQPQEQPNPPRQTSGPSQLSAPTSGGPRSAHRFPPPPSLQSVNAVFGGGGPSGNGNPPTASSAARPVQQQQPPPPPLSASRWPAPASRAIPQPEDRPVDTHEEADMKVGGCTPQQWKLRALQWLEAYTAELYARKLYVPLNELLLIFPEITQEPGNPVQPRAADIAYEKQMTYVFCGECEKSELDARVPKAKAGGDAEGNLKYFQNLVGHRHKQRRPSHTQRRENSPWHPSRTASVTSPRSASTSADPSSFTSTMSSSSSSSSFRIGSRGGLDGFSDDLNTSSSELSTPSLTNLRPEEDPDDGHGITGFGEDFLPFESGATRAGAGAVPTESHKDAGRDGSDDDDDDDGSSHLSSSRRRRRHDDTRHRQRGRRHRRGQRIAADPADSPTSTTRTSSCVSATSESSRDATGKHSFSASSSSLSSSTRLGGVVPDERSSLASSGRPGRSRSVKQQQRQPGRRGHGHHRLPQHKRATSTVSTAATHAGAAAAAGATRITPAASATAAPFVELTTAVAYDAANQSLPPADNAACRRCHNRLAMRCVICEEVVEGMYYWLRSCGHGGHVHHMEEWLKISNECPQCGVPMASAVKPL